MKSYKQFIKESKVLSKTDKDFIHSKLYHKIIFHGISNNYTINPDGSIDVDGEFDNNVSFDPSRSSSTKLRYKPSKKNKLTELPIKFNKVGGYFYCNDNELTTLEGSPKEVGGDFKCNENKLTSLEGGPVSVGGDFICRNNQLTSLQGAPKKVGGDFYCSRNELKSLVGCPEIIHGDFYCRENQITDFKGVPEFFEGLFYCEENPIEEIYRLFIQEDKHITDFSLLYGLDGLSKCIKWINEFDVIQGNRVIMDRLEEVFYQLGMDVPENINLPSYEII
jgi:hypothetical protein